MVKEKLHELPKADTDKHTHACKNTLWYQHPKPPKLFQDVGVRKEGKRPF